MTGSVGGSPLASFSDRFFFPRQSPCGRVHSPSQTSFGPISRSRRISLSARDSPKTGRPHTCTSRSFSLHCLAGGFPDRPSNAPLRPVVPVSLHCPLRRLYLLSRQGDLSSWESVLSCGNLAGNPPVVVDVRGVRPAGDVPRWREGSGG